MVRTVINAYRPHRAETLIDDNFCLISYADCHADISYFLIPLHVIFIMYIYLKNNYI